jgi:hypothetical protein
MSAVLVMAVSFGMVGRHARRPGGQHCDGSGDRLVSGHGRPAGVPGNGRGAGRQVVCRAPSQWGGRVRLGRNHHRRDHHSGGDHVGANPVDRGKPGPRSKLHLRRGLPLIAAANAALQPGRPRPRGISSGLGSFRQAACWSTLPTVPAVWPPAADGRTRSTTLRSAVAHDHVGMSSRLPGQMPEDELLGRWIAV